MLGAWHWALKRLLDRITIPIVYLRSKVCICEMRNGKVNISYTHWPPQSIYYLYLLPEFQMFTNTAEIGETTLTKIVGMWITHILLPC